MNKTDRLNAIIVYLQTKKIVKAKELSERFEVSLRTIYRDMLSLQEAGIPVLSQEGIGYTLMDGYSLPPVMFTLDEAASFLIGGKLIDKFSDQKIQENYFSGLNKIRAIIPDENKEFITSLESRVETDLFNFNRNEEKYNHISEVNSALAENRVIEIEYTSSGNNTTRRIIEPLYLYVAVPNTHLIAYCRLRNEYRIFRIDRIKNINKTGEAFDRKKHGDIKNIFNKMLNKMNTNTVIIKARNGKTYESIKKRAYCILEDKEENGYHELHMIIDSLDIYGKILLEFCDEIEVISPTELIEIMKSFTEKLYKHYNR